MPLACQEPETPFFTSTLLSFRYVKTTANATVDHLSKYLALRIALEEAPGPGPEPPALEDVSEKQYTIYITTAGGAFTVMGCLCVDGWGAAFWRAPCS